MSEHIDTQMKDSDRIYREVIRCGFDTNAEAQQMIVLTYIPDMSISRSGISHASKRVEKFYKDK
jgi:hypothetical protein